MDVFENRGSLVGRIKERSDAAPAKFWQPFSPLLPELVALGPAYKLPA